MSMGILPYEAFVFMFFSLSLLLAVISPIFHSQASSSLRLISQSFFFHSAPTTPTCTPSSE